MARTHIDKRSRLVSAAVGLAYQNGFGATSLADIAREADVPLGNVYYYFKTKDDIGDAIVELRLAQLSAQRQRWNEAGSLLTHEFLALMLGVRRAGVTEALK